MWDDFELHGLREIRGSVNPQNKNLARGEGGFTIRRGREHWGLNLKRRSTRSQGGWWDVCPFQSGAGRKLGCRADRRTDQKFSRLSVERLPTMFRSGSGV